MTSLRKLAEAATPGWIGSERSATALGLPEAHTRGGLPVYPASREIHHARTYIARVISEHWLDKSDEHTTTYIDAVTNHPHDSAEVWLTNELAEGE